MEASDLKEARQTLGFNIKQMAEALKTPYRTYQDLERGAKIRGIYEIAVNLLLKSNEMTDQNKLFDDTEKIIKIARELLADDSATAEAIDREDSWDDIAGYANEEGHDELADALKKARELWIA